MRWPGLLKQGENQTDYKTKGESIFYFFVLPNCFPCYVRSAKYLFLIPLKVVFAVFAICICTQPSIVFVFALIHLIALSNSSLAISRCYSLPYLISNCQAKHNIALVCIFSHCIIYKYKYQLFYIQNYINILSSVHFLIDLSRISATATWYLLLLPT